MAEYAKRDRKDLGEFFVIHMDAMTGEGLHDKADIAAELAWRDREIARLTHEVAVAKAFHDVVVKERNAAQIAETRAKMGLY